VLKKINRLKKKRDFESVFNKGAGIKESFLYFKFIANNLEYSRFGIVVGKKVSNKAVQRNKIKRIIRRALKIQMAELKKNIDAVLVVLPQKTLPGPDEVAGSIGKIFLKISRVKNRNQ